MDLSKEEIVYIFNKYLQSMYTIQEESYNSDDMEMRQKCAANIMFINSLLSNIDSIYEERYKYLIDAIKYLEPRFEVWNRGRNR